VDCDEELAPELVLEGGGRVRADLVLWAAGAAPPAVLKQFELPQSDRGFLTIRPTLQTTADAPIFVAGDAAEWPGRPLPKAGVYAVRQAQVLWQNLRRWQSGDELIEYQPQPTFLSLLNCGDGTALLEWNGWSVHSRWAWWLKRRIDLAFVRQFR
jgi:selenide,water dikinase